MTLTDRPITVEQVKLLIRGGEGLTVEFKERYTPRIDEDIVAFTNAKGGTLLLGVRDDGIVVGERLTNDLKAKINSLARNCKPSITTELSQVGVEVYDNRVEIVNPGGLPKGLSVRNLGTVSIRRNELISDLFFRLHKVERIGMGIQKMKEAMVAAGLREPTFASDAFFRATFQRSPEFALKEGKGKGVREKFGEGAEELEEKLGEKLAENERHILRLIHSNRRISINDMAKEVGISTTAVHKNLTKLKQRDILRRVGPDKGGHWEVVR
jgi:ATP-dependent DNA helicase RecG